ncbi:SMARCA4 [Cordylochernes scorpioides]|uniref:SMARCA4 n=1 Tax=Cordylochernes scorpioides TaxID=51811 RepID=A0ABY6KFW1_9ARAC|nr:SMARCA4 [Cordylochernes scorpioides]
MTMTVLRQDWVYWSDWESESIHRANKFTGSNHSIMVRSAFSPMDLHIIHPYKQPKGENYCHPNNGRCSHLCLPSPFITPRSARYSCVCPNGMDLGPDQRTCYTNAEDLLPEKLPTGR